MAIERPRKPSGHKDRLSDCQMAIEDRLLELFGEAVAAGWAEDEVFAAIVSVADTTQLAMHQEQLVSVETQLRRAMTKRDL
ncbi:hypothetical protein SAMN05428967_2230 [Phyllobacterium sp. YR620]|uniref:hypothetical protein n=1 Tax=Phyllobacterium sp. YR620 TaxID=1881066 RepID=UPI000883F77F|nr:hypothetical protein [Phyllobacterium sp. YR620]SDP46272.1 hypothetical protein SAMN05428967_2230 [Phyllobacterium sp. YR620]